MADTPTIKCTCCDGKGWVLGVPSCDSRYFDRTPVCPLCKGSKAIPVPGIIKGGEKQWVKS